MEGKFLEVIDLSIGSLGIDFVLEGREYFFEGKNLISLFVFDFPDVPVCTGAQLGNDLIVALDRLLKLLF
jgi:hypothetical protein